MTGDRKALVAVVILAMLAIFGITQLQGVVYRQQVHSLRSTLYTECVSRVPYDAKSQQVRAAFRDYYLRYITTESHNRFVDASLREQRVKDARLLVASLDAVLAVNPIAKCKAIKP